jgi:hypothetical protein
MTYAGSRENKKQGGATWVRTYHFLPQKKPKPGGVFVLLNSVCQETPKNATKFCQRRVSLLGRREPPPKKLAAPCVYGALGFS